MLYHMRDFDQKVRFLLCSLILLALSIGATFIVSIKSWAKPPEEMVLYLSFDEENGNIVEDLSIYKNNAEIKGNPKRVKGRFGMALELNGSNDYLVVKNAPSLQLTEALTISCWVKITGGGAQQSAVEKEPAWQAGEYNLIPVYNGLVLLQMYDLPDDCDDEGAMGSVKDNNWHYVVGTWDGKAVYTYIDGELNSKRDCGGGKLEKGSGDLYIGSRGGTERFLMGLIDEVKIYNRALSNDEIKDDMTNPRYNLSVDELAEKLSVLWGSLKHSK